MKPAGVADAAQLDLVAEQDAVDQRVAQAAAERAAQPIFASPAHSYASRVAAFAGWADQHGHFDCIRRSHGWHEEPAAADSPTDLCRPTTLVANLCCDHDGLNCSCVGDLIWRGACRRGDWEGPVRGDHNPAVEDAHDHAWPGLRTLPVVADRRPESGTAKPAVARMARWVDTVDELYPAGWLEAGGPIRTARGPLGTRHVPDGTGFGGYELSANDPTGDVDAEVDADLVALGAPPDDTTQFEPEQAAVR